MRIVPISEVTYEEIVDVLDKSGLIIYPTETCYGIGCNPCDTIAVEKLLRYKTRREGKAISIAVSDVQTAEQYVELNETARKIYERFLPGPYTVISKSKGVVVPGIEAEDGTQAIRIPEYSWLIDLLNHYKKPITATSANQSYQKTPYKIQDIIDNTSEKSLQLIDLIIDAGELAHNPPSTILNTTLGDVQVLRKGEFLPENAKVNESISHTEAETIAFGERMLQQYAANLEFRPILFALQGDLGAGKTHFTKGVALALGIEKPILSPTFILSREYNASLGNRLHHIDTWRLESAHEVEELGINEMLSETHAVNADTLNTQFEQLTGKFANKSVYNVVVIEWADKIVEYLRALNMNVKILWIEIVVDEDDPQKRIIRWSE